MIERASRGPAAPLFGVGHLLRLRRDQLAFYRDMHAAHGDAVPLRLGPYRSWLLFHPDQIEAALATTATSFVRFRPVMDVLRQWNGESLLVSEGERWRARRRQVLPAFASRRLPGYGERVVDRTAALVSRWRLKVEHGELRVDTDREMVALTLDLASDTLFGEPLGDEAARIGDAVAVLSEVAFAESTSPVRVPHGWPSRGQARKRWATAQVRGSVERIVAGRLRAPSDRGDLLSTLLEDGAADLKAVVDEATTLLIAGHETTGAALTWSAFLLGGHAEALARLQGELDTVLGGRLPTMDDLARLPFLSAVVDEILRLFPPAYALFPRRATEAVEVAGVQLRKGDLVQVVPFITQRDGRWFEDPEAFRPERFLQPPTWPRYAYLPFGAGPRVCIGQAFGRMEVTLALTVLLQHVAPGTADGPVVPDPKFSLRPLGGLPQRWRFLTA